ncbi:MAG: hypothetical protein GY943_36880 [Chloroflexi bacterium]|nr:hypothetical protein [Chloroflexota bacterium]
MDETKPKSLWWKKITVGGIKILLESDEQRLWPYAKRRYQNFFSADDIPVDETIALFSVKNPAIPASNQLETAVITNKNKTAVQIIRGRGIAKWDRQQHHCHIEQSIGDFAPPAQHPDYVLDSVLRIILSFRLMEMNACLVHSAGLIRDGEGHLFVGVSGAGKSTLSRISMPTATVLSDDLTLLALKNGGCEIFGTPFYGDFGSGGANQNAPLKGIYFLQKAPQNKLERMTPDVAWRQFMRSIMFFGQDKSSTQTIMDLTWNICLSVPCHTLSFLPDDSFWRLIYV